MLDRRLQLFYGRRTVVFSDGVLCMIRVVCCRLLHSDHLFKLVLIGDSGVGKSCLLLRFAVRVSCVLYTVLAGCGYGGGKKGEMNGSR